MNTLNPLAVIPPHPHPLAGAVFLRDACAIELSPPRDGELHLSEWVHLIPTDSFSGRDGRGPYVLDSAAVLAAFSAGAIDLSVDYDHQSLTAEQKSGPVPAAGWIKKLEAHADGIWGFVEWTQQAAELLRDKAYRFLSPVFNYTAHDRRVVALTGAGLTHQPNLYLQAVSSQQGNPMEDLIEEVRELLNLPTLTSKDELLAALKTLMERITAADAAVMAAQAREPSPAEFVPVAMHRQVADQLAALQSQQQRAAAELAVTEALAAHKISPALRPWAATYAEQDLAGFKAYVQAAPSILEPASVAHQQQASSVLSEEETYVATALGLSRDDMLQAKLSAVRV